MRRRISRSFIFIVGLIAALGMAPAMFAQGGEDDPEWSDISVGCGPELQPCTAVDGYQTYTVTLDPAVYIPETLSDGSPVVFDYTMVVRVRTGTIAFRAQTPDVIVEQAQEGNELQLIQSTFPLAFGTPPSTFTNPYPDYDPFRLMEPNECFQPPLSQLCLLAPQLFDDEQTFLQLGPGDTLYLPAGSTCFVCNLAEPENPGAEDVVLDIWAPGSGTIWSELSQSMVGPASNRLDRAELHDARGWMLNPGTRCN